MAATTIGSTRPTAAPWIALEHKKLKTILGDGQTLPINPKILPQNLFCREK